MVRAPARAATTIGLLTVAASGLSLSACGEGNPGIDPLDDALSFPSGLMLDPRVSTAPGADCSDDASVCSEGEVCTSAGACQSSAQWLFVTNANSDRAFNAGSLVAIDLDGFWAAYEDTEAIQAPSATLDRDDPERRCRLIANLPQAVECLEEPFIAADSTVRFGNFPGPAAAWVHGEDEATLLIPVRGDPSVTYVEVSGDGAPRFECGQDQNPDDPRRCGDDHRLRFLRKDPDARRIASEPFRVLVSPGPGRPLAYVSHQGAPDLTVISLDGLSTLVTSGGVPAIDGGVFAHEYRGGPAIVHQYFGGLLLEGAALSIQGGFGLAQYPCDPSNAPDVSLACERPLIYAAMRWALQLRTFTAIEHEVEPGQVCENPSVDPGALNDALRDADSSERITGQIACEPRAQPLTSIDPGGFSTAGLQLSPSRPLLADIGFSRTGEQLYVVQSNPGGLLRVDTSLGDDGELRNLAAGQVEVCAQPTSLVIYDDGQVEYGIVTCYRSGEVFIVDLAELTVVGLSRAGIGPDAMAVDLAREVVYVANTLDATISVIDMNPQHATRFTQIARIGVQEPYVQ